MKIRGSITVFISIVLSVLIAFSGIVVDLCRFGTGEKLARAAVQLSVQSALTQYFAPLKDNYGLWANGYSNEELEVLIYELIEKNLSVENVFMPGITDLFSFSVDNVTVCPMYNLADEYVLEKEITQFMKYRAPVNTLGLFLEKLKAFNIFLAQSGLLKKRMDLEDKLQKVREEQVYLSLLLSEKISLFLNNGKPMKEISHNLLSMSQLCGEIKGIEKPNQELDRAYESMPPLIEKIKEGRTRINEIKKEITDLEYEVASLEKEYAQVERKLDSYCDRIEDYEKEIAKLEKKISDEEKKDEPDENLIRSYKAEISNLKNAISVMEGSISSLNAELDEIYDDIRNTGQKISQKNEQIKSISKSIENEEKQLLSEIDKCVGILGNIKLMSENIKENMLELKDTVCKFIAYHEEAIKLISGILTKSEEISRLSDEIDFEIKEQSEKSDNAFLVMIKADMEKLSLAVSPEIMNAIKTDLDRNLDLLDKANAAADSLANNVDVVIGDIQFLINRTKQIYENLNSVERDVFGSRLEHHVNKVNEEISLAVSLYKLASYDLEPAVNTKEKNEFYRWCNKVFGEDNETGSRDKGYEKKLRENIKKADDKGKEENEGSFNGKDGDMTDEELEKLFNSLPSYKNGESMSPDLAEDTNTQPEERYKKSLDTNSNVASKIGEILSGAGEAMLKTLYINEYIICAFKNANIDKVPVQRINLLGGPSKTFFEKAEVEYILFGKKKEKANANLAQLSIFGIRMGLNLLHVYMNTDKTAAALTAAVSISGWTGFGVPIVKNLILFGWAAGESYLDLKDINAGKDVPVYKTKNTWRLSLESLFTGIAGQFLDESSKWMKQTKDELIYKVDDAVKALVQDLVSGAVNEAFLPLEQAITEFGNETDSAPDVEINDPGILNEINDVNDLKAWIKDICQEQYQAAKGKVSDWTKVKLEDYKKRLTGIIVESIIDSPAYKKLLSLLKESLNNVIDAGSNSISDSLKQLGASIGDQGLQSQLLGTVVSFDYTDYLRLLLIAVPKKLKLLRAADLIQLNLRETLDNPDFMMSEYNSFIIVDAEISMKAMFIPSFPGGKEPGRFKIRWGYGY